VNGDAWRYAPNLANAQRALLQAALTAFLTIRHAEDRVNPEEFATALDWRAVSDELKSALRLAGHPAGTEEVAAMEDME
jgi:hypothetical protein